ncbi:hypothetical protein RHMOL_Rhmol13G0296000 [Rhododendron molle]|uniref:Uncharacterized protein n=1 Tax=Rhododendron molle TaxID=49168 RepID=A0ACC0LD59_RHOML|nr:hypothetical protein RHMOL_Rhmol13G0296000 [Rhododendron molle]
MNIKSKSFPGSIRAIATSDEKSTRVKAVVSVKVIAGGLLSGLGLAGGLDKITDLFGKSLLLELVSAELDPKTELEKENIKGYARKVSQDDDEVKYESDFEVGADFGEIGAVLVENEHHKEMHLKTITLEGLLNGNLIINCNSWVSPKSEENVEKRVFFTDKSYLPFQTPNGLRRLREKELAILQGNGQGERKSSDRIYDYDVYNDLGDPDSSSALKRPVLGGKQHPYPRHPMSETRSSDVYVPRDEAFSTVKSVTFSVNTVSSVLHALVPSLETAIIDSDLGFPYFTKIDSLFNEGVNLPPLSNKYGLLRNLLPRLVKFINDTKEDLLRFETPAIIERDKFSWFRDAEFSRQTLAGLNPCSIQLVTEWPLKSKLDPKVYGNPNSLITEEIVECEIKGFMTLQEALKRKKLFILDYHDLLLPYVKKVREVEGTTLYGSRTLFFLTDEGTLRPLAIELTRPPMDRKPQWRQVFTPTWNATGCWLWRLAKAHVLAHDSGYHQLVSHWLRTHCATEPYIIAANRQLSVIHPIFRLMHPHFRYTMEINALAREALINASGIIETSFSPAKGMAVEDPTAPHGLKLTIEDYPYANDGLMLWDAIKQWVTDYVKHYYPDSALVQSDKELQAWWTEIRTIGHADKKDEPWWPKLKTVEDLIGILTTMIWVASGHHSAVNFGQYDFAGYFPNRPTIARTNMPTEDPNDEEMKFFLAKPEVVLLKCFPSQIQATKVMAVLDILSTHSPEEEYIGAAIEGVWADNPFIKAAFERFSGKLKVLEGVIDARNANRNLNNRSGAGVVPYELLKPFSVPGVTSMGVPNSISI